VAPASRQRLIDFQPDQKTLAASNDFTNKSVLLLSQCIGSQVWRGRLKIGDVFP
jgi:hypothetical protein